MKRVFICLLILLTILSYTASAQVNVTITDSANNKVCISGDAPSGQEVFLVVLNDGSTKEDVKQGVADSVVYARTQRADSDGYCFDFILDTPRGGQEFTALVSYGDTKESQVFSFYSDSAKQLFIDDISTGEITDEDVDDALVIFNLSDDPLAQGIVYGSVADLLEKIREENNGFSQNSTIFANTLKQALIINGLNNGNEELFSGNNLLYQDILGIDALAQYEDYNMINAEGASLVKNALLSGKYTGLSDLKKAYSEAVLLNVLTNYKELGYAHVGTYFEKYEQEYEQAGFELSRLSKVSKKSTLYSFVAESSKESLDLLASEFNAKAKALSESSQSSGGGGGGGGGNTTVSTDSTDPIGQLPAKEELSGGESQNGKITFSDVSNDFWAAQYIYALAGMGIINGRGEGTFSPFDMVSRSEFVKMIVLALGMTPDESLCSFEDMKTSWAKPYVGVAVQAGFVSGVSATQFAPDLKINREQASTMVSRAMKLDAPKTPNIFTDHSDISDYAKDHVYALRAKGIIDGRTSNAGFAPKDELSRAEAAKIIYLMIQ